MCLAVPGLIVAIERRDGLLMGKIDFGGVSKRACLDYVPDAQVGDFVIVHVGFALSRIDAEEAKRVFALLAELNEVSEVTES
jgi:hydrogenase expression/formation protein HypC